MDRAIDCIKTLNLDYLARRLVTKENWNEKEAADAVRRYKNFLILRCKHLDVMAVPTPDIDEVWHAHILHTREYMRDCQQIFGKYLHHAPSSDTEEEKLQLGEAFDQFAKLYLKEFGEMYSGVLDVSSFW